METTFQCYLDGHLILAKNILSVNQLTKGWKLEHEFVRQFDIDEYLYEDKKTYLQTGFYTL